MKRSWRGKNERQRFSKDEHTGGNILKVVVAVVAREVVASRGGKKKTKGIKEEVNERVLEGEEQKE